MKKALFFLMIIISPFIFSSCVFMMYIFTRNSFDNYECMTAEDLTTFMNKQGFGTTFTLIDSEYIEQDHYKMRVVYLKTKDLPGKTIIACQDYSSERTTIVSYNYHFFTDYFFYKYEDEVYAEFEKLYAPLVEGLEKNKEWKLVLKPKIESFGFHYDDDRDKKEEEEKYSSAKNMLKLTIYEAYLLINKEYSAETERDYNAFMYDLQNTYEEENWYNYGYEYWDPYYYEFDSSDPISSDAGVKKIEKDRTPFANLHCYYSENILASEVTNKELTSDSFGLKEFVFVPDGEKK